MKKLIYKKVSVSMIMCLLVGIYFSVIGQICAQDTAVLSGKTDVSVVFKIADIFNHNMVLQSGRPIPVWGNAEAGTRIKVSYAGNSADTVSDADGHWFLYLDQMSVSTNPGTLKIENISGSEKLILTNVVVGEVWLASGQSNMELPLYKCFDAEDVIKSSGDRMLRYINIRSRISDVPQETITGRWQEITPAVVRNMSGTAYFFARQLREKINVPVGIIQSDLGGTPVAGWMPKDSLEKHPLFTPLLDYWQEKMDAYPENLKIYNEAMSKWKENKEKGIDQGKAPRRPVGPGHRFTPSGLYNGMINPIVPYAIRGAIWYQGEHDTSRAYQYRELFKTMIVNWRIAWGQGDFPFLFVQLPNFGKKADQPKGGDWAEQREAQSMALCLPNTGMAVTYDVGEGDNLHPRDKKSVGTRLSLIALNKVYDQNIVCSGPTYQSMLINKDKVVLEFDHVEGGLVTLNGELLKGFSIAGRDHVFRWAKAAIDGDTVVCSHPDISEPVAIRYAWNSNPIGNLYNKKQLPAAPFRTDCWPGRTINKRRGM